MLSISLLLLFVQMEPIPHLMLIPAASTVRDSAVPAYVTTDLQLFLSGTQVSSCDIFLARQTAC